MNGFPYVTLTDPDTKLDVGKGLVSDGILLVEKRREKRLNKLVSVLLRPTFSEIIN